MLGILVNSIKNWNLHTNSWKISNIFSLKILFHSQFKLLISLNEQSFKISTFIFSFISFFFHQFSIELQLLFNNLFSK